jgi:putative sigma-54 modulation protein
MEGVKDMKFQFRGKNIQVTDGLKEHVEKKLGKLDKYFDVSPEAIVALIVEKERHRVEVTIPLNGYILRGEEESPDMYSSVDLVIDKIERQMEKYKTRLSKKVKGLSVRNIATSAEKLLPGIPGMPTDSEFPEEEGPHLVRTKRFAFKPMMAEEAIMQMNLLSHGFFVFSNAETDEINVVYRRKDGNYGLIEPDIG